ncbi:DeoR family transcriptional regulator [Saccharomonospora piscinae]|uniref:DeoR family transcriptional regulator n=1 Tax=Saccharomonospora piscinae TaxID=687388 RepID=A0A1V9A645_SACPI|nr:DeoR/GlpR family DNA-binding transcription regulator [Saccharomonospora piscinae]OQO92612.1 DeoR family transcriptional regulator [Saccharomonospora piscinae]
MLARQRQAVILEETRRSGAVRVSELVHRLGVSDMTIRRDLDVLAGRGLVEKVYGGATNVAPAGGELDRDPCARQRRLHTAIAVEAARLVRPGTAVGLSSGAASRSLARVLEPVPDLTVVTNSLAVADIAAASARPDRVVVLTGGVRGESDVLVGPLAVQSLRGLHLDLVFLGVHGIAERSGCTVPSLSESEADRALVEAGRTLVVLADHTCWGVAGIATVAALSDADVLISDDGLDASARDILAARVGELVIAKSPDTDTTPTA